MQFFRKREIKGKKGNRGKIFENLGKNVKNLEILRKRAGDCM